VGWVRVGEECVRVDEGRVRVRISLIRMLPGPNLTLTLKID
jgi:hypothetical protein